MLIELRTEIPGSALASERMGSEQACWLGRQALLHRSTAIAESSNIETIVQIFNHIISLYRVYFSWVSCEVLDNLPRLLVGN